MISEYFSKYEAQSKVGRRIKTNREFTDVPIGSYGVVESIYKAAWGDTGSYGLNIKWELNHHIVDGFSKDEYDEFLEEV